MIISEVTKQARSTDPTPKKVKPSKGNESPHPMRGKLVGEADEPKDVSARTKLDHSLRAQGHKVEKDRKKAAKRGEVKHKGRPLEEGPLVINREVDLLRMLDTLLDSWKSGKHTDDEYAELLKALGYKMDKKGDRTVLTKEELEEAPGAIRKGLAAVALIAGLWGVNNQIAQQAYDSSPQLQKLTAYLEVAKEHNDQRMIDQLEQRIENHKTRLDIGKGDVMGKDGKPIDIVYDKEKNESTNIPFNQCPSCGGEIVHVSEAEGKKDACYHKVKSRYKVWPSAYASGALVQCRKKGAKNWGNSSKK